MKTKTKKQEDAGDSVVISKPSLATAEFDIVGTAPYIQLNFSEKARNAMMEKMRLGSQANKKRAKEARDFDEDFKQAPHYSDEGWYGIPAGSFRNGMISACRLVGFKMTIAKLSVYVEADGFDRLDGTPLVRIEGKPVKVIHPVRNATGVADIRVRAKFWPWSASLKITFDTEQFSTSDVANLLSRVGAQVGIGEGRPDSKSSAGMGWGTFKLG